MLLCVVACCRNRQLRETLPDELYTIGASTFYRGKRLVPSDEEDDDLEQHPRYPMSYPGAALRGVDNLSGPNHPQAQAVMYAFFCQVQTGLYFLSTSIVYYVLCAGLFLGLLFSVSQCCRLGWNVLLPTGMFSTPVPLNYRLLANTVTEERNRQQRKASASRGYSRYPTHAPSGHHLEVGRGQHYLPHPHQLPLPPLTDIHRLDHLGLERLRRADPQLQLTQGWEGLPPEEELLSRGARERASRWVSFPQVTVW